MQIVSGVGGALVEAPVGQRLIGAPQLRHVPQGMEGNGADVHLSFLPQLHHGDGFFVCRLGKRVLQRRTAVADMGSARALGVMDVPQSHIVKRLYRPNIHIIDSSYRKCLRIASLRQFISLIELMGDQHVAPAAVVNLFPPDQFRDSIPISLRRFSRKYVSYIGRLQKWQQIKIHLPIFII